MKAEADEKEKIMSQNKDKEANIEKWNEEK